MKVIQRTLGPLLVIGTAVMLLIGGIYSPTYDWDIIGYVASAHYADGLRGAELSRRTYDDVKQQVGPDVFDGLVAGRYRRTVHDDPRSLEQQLPYYRIRIAFVQSMRALKWVGLSYPKSTVTISALFSAASMFLLALLCREMNLSLLWVAPAASIAGFGALARLPLPDAMACFFALLTTWLVIKGDLKYFAVAAVLPLFRTDFVVLSVLVAAAGFFRGRRMLSTLSMVTALVLFISINALMRHYGWLTQFNVSLISVQPYPQEMTFSRQPLQYLMPYVRGAWNAVFHPHGAIYMLGIACAVRGILSPLRDDIKLSIGLAYLFVAMHMVLYPVYEDRFFVYAAAVVFLGTASAVTTALSDGSIAGWPGLTQALRNARGVLSRFPPRKA